MKCNIGFVLSSLALLSAGAFAQTVVERVDTPLRNRTWISTGNPVPREIPAPEFSENPVHPRLFFSGEDIPDIRERAGREPYASMVRAMREYVESGEDWNPWYGLGWRLRMMAMLYVISGEQADADRTLEMVQEMRSGRSPEHRGVWHRVERRQLNLSEGAVSVAIAYDFCYHAWPEEVRREISRDLAENARAQLHSYGPGYPSRGSANNWRGIRFAGAGIALLASDEPHLAPARIQALDADPMNPDTPFAGIDPRWIDVAYDQVRAYMRVARTEDPTARGMNAEGVGYMLYPQTLIGPYAIAHRKVTGVSLADDNPAFALGPVLAAMSAVPIPTLNRPGSPRKHGGLRPDLANENPGYASQGELAVSLPLVFPEHLPAYRWHFDHFSGHEGLADFQPVRAGTLFAYLFYPEDIPSENPEASWGLNLLDGPTGTVVARDRYQDANDVVFMTTARQRGVFRQTHHGAEIGSLRLFGEGTLFLTGGGRTSALGGQSIVLNSENLDGSDNRSAGRLEQVYLLENGSASLTIHGSPAGLEEARRSILLDTRPGDSPARAHLLVADSSQDGDIWRINVPGIHRVTLLPDAFEITATNGARLRGDVLHPRDARLEQGVWERSGNVGVGEEISSENRWVQIHSAATEGPHGFLVAMQILPPGVEPAPAEGVNPGGTLHIGDQTYRLDARGLRRNDWPRQLELTLEAVPAGGGRVEGAGVYSPGEEIPLRAVPAEGHRFVRWESARPMSGQPWKSNPEYNLRITDHTHARAVFELVP